jgi:hypothetical protein
MADNNGGFLGGGPQFNKVGAPAPSDGTEVEEPPTQSMQPYQVRNLAIVLFILVLFGLLFYMEYHPGGVTHRQGRGGVSTDDQQKQQSTPSNF